MASFPIDENLSVEFKSAFTPNVAKEVVAFANSEGGTLYLGIADDGTPVGIDHPRETVLQIANTLRDSIKPDVMPFVSIDVEQDGDASIVVVHVNRGTKRPYHLASKGPRPEGTFVRQGSASVPASESAILRMIKETDGDSFEDALSLVQDLTFASARSEFELRDVPFEPAHMRTLGVVNQDGLFTNLGLLLSDQCPPLIKVAAFQGRKDEGAFTSRDRKEFSGSLFDQLNDAYAYLDFRNGTKSRLIGLHRIDERDYPEEALREALVNAVVHRSYEMNAPTLIKLYDDRLEITSPGGLPAGIELEDLELEVSIQRNPKLAHIFYRLQLIEAYGFGIQLMRTAYREESEGPAIDVTPNFFRITLPNVNALSDGSERADVESDDEIMALVESHGGSVKRADIEAAFGISRSTAASLLGKLIDAGKLVAEGKGPARRYVLP